MKPQTAEQLLRELQNPHNPTSEWTWQKTQLPSAHEKQKLQEMKRTLIISLFVSFLSAPILMYFLRDSGLSFTVIILIGLLSFSITLGMEMWLIHRLNTYLNTLTPLPIQYTLRIRPAYKQAKGLSAGMGVTVSLDYTTLTQADWQHILPSGGQDAIQQLAQQIPIKLK